MAKFPTMEEFVQGAVEIVLGGFEINGKTIREWVECITQGECAFVAREWISVTERLPEKQADVLLLFGGKYKNMAVGFWHGEKGMNAVYWCAYTDDGFYTDCDYKPTHWMPLPELPKEG